MGKVKVAVPLFDRLVDEFPHKDSENIPFNSLTKEQLFDSIKKEIEIILNSRRGITSKENNALFKDSPFEFGFIDFTRLQRTDYYAWVIISDTLKKIILKYEPRLRTAKIKIKQFNKKKLILVLEIQATVKIAEVKESFHFTTYINNFEEGLKLESI